MAGVTTTLAAVLEDAWQAIRDRHPDVPDVVLTIGSGTIGLPAGQVRLGHFAAARWELAAGQERRAELFVGGEGLARGPLDVLDTLLHEAAHGVAHVRGTKDTSRQGRYHNAAYKVLAEELGLDVAQTGAIGWSGTTVPPGTAEAYSVTLAAIEAALVLFRHPEGSITFSGPGGGGAGPGTTPGGGPAGGAGTGGPKEKNGVSALCGCGRRIRVSRSVLESGPIICGVCSTEFAVA